MKYGIQLDKVNLFFILIVLIIIIIIERYRRPVVYYLFGKQDIQETLKIITRKQIFDYHIWQNDAINELCYHKTIESGSMISSCTLVMDVAGMTSNNVSPEFLHILNRRAEVNGRYFPYLFDRILIINAISTDSKMIRTLKDFCSLYSPRANVYVTGNKFYFFHFFN